MTSASTTLQATETHTRCGVYHITHRRLYRLSAERWPICIGNLVRTTAGSYAIEQLDSLPDMLVAFKKLGDAGRMNSMSRIEAHISNLVAQATGNADFQCNRSVLRRICYALRADASEADFSFFLVRSTN
jgi:hypothetical protein